MEGLLNTSLYMRATHLHNIIYIVFNSRLMFECKQNSSAQTRPAEVLQLRDTWPISLSSTCNLIQRGEEGSASLPPA